MVKTELIEKYIVENNLSKSRFCQMYKISYGTLKKILNHDGNFRISALFKIAKVLNIYVYQLVN